MTAFTVATNTNFDAQTGGSVNATLDTYAISAGAVLTVRTDTYACPNHSAAFGSLDTVSFSGVGGELRFDPTYVRVVAYTGGSGNSPAYGAAISQGGVSGVFLGAWANWQSEPIVPGAAIPATGFIKIGGKAGGDFAAGALTGIAATCSGADVQGWIEVRGPDTATITVPRIGKVTSIEAWFELGTTSGARGQILPCPTTATAAGVWPGVWIETSAGSGVYERFSGVGSQVALAATATDVRARFIWQTTAGIRIGSDGTNNVGFLPPAGCKVRIPAIIWTNCTRAVSGSGPRVLPNATVGTRQEFITTGAGNDYGESGAITVNDATGTPITGTISAAAINFDFDYDANVQGGFAGGTDRPVTLIGIRPGTGKYVVATGTLTRSKSIALSLVAETDRAYV